jgi:multiple sugar transport system substrate-binding protein
MGKKAARAAKKLSDPAKGVYGVGAALDSQQNFYNTIFQAGGNVISTDGGTSSRAGVAVRRPAREP